MSVERTPAFRLCFGALHVVMRAGYAEAGHTLARPGDAVSLEQHIDWPATMQLRRAMDAFGIGVAEAMDTAQRFFLGWPSARRLIAETGALRLANGFCAGAGTDQLPRVRGAADLVDVVVEQCAYITSHGGIPVILPMPWLSEQRAGEQEFVEVYGAIIRQVRGPVFLHWLGPMFLESLQGYFPGRSFDRIMAIDPSVVRGCKLSLLDRGFEERVRRALLPTEQIVLTGDDFHFGELILGDGAAPTRTTMVGEREVAFGDFSHALLGILDAIARPTQHALRQLQAGDRDGYSERMARCEELGRFVFQEPTQHYKAGLAFLAWLNGQQDNFLLVNREDLCRDRGHYLRCAELARAADCVHDEATFAARLAEFEAGDW
ncbi:MAG: DUF993 family protein, partial [Planctomycetes bacterium]|nr:DUF993 family protein [Planctomycetota bacterium]